MKKEVATEEELRKRHTKHRGDDRDRKKEGHASLRKWCYPQVELCFSPSWSAVWVAM